MSEFPEECWRQDAVWHSCVRGWECLEGFPGPPVLSHWLVEAVARYCTHTHHEFYQVLHTMKTLSRNVVTVLS